MAVAVCVYASFILARAFHHPGLPSPGTLSLYAGFAYAAFQWGCIVAILGFGRRRLSRDAPARRYLTEAVFPFYIVHQMTIIATDTAIRDLGLPAWQEAAVAIAATAASCVLTYEIVRRVWWLRPLFGLKREPRSGGRVRPDLGERLSAQRAMADDA